MNRQIIINVNDCGCCKCHAPQRPGKPALYFKEQTAMAQFGLKFSLPVPGASDVTTRELTITVNGGDPPTVKTYPGTTLLTDQLVFAQDDELSLTLVDIDGTGNRSPASAAFVYSVIDDIPPSQPGVVGVGEKVQLP